MAILFALISLPLFGAAGLAVDYSAAAGLEGKLQQGADAAALAAATRSEGDFSDPQALAKVAEAAFRSNTPIADAVLNFEVDKERAVVRVSVSHPHDLYFPFFGERWNIGVVAEAVNIPDRPPLCLLALGTSGTGFSLSGSASFTAPDCVVQTNSTATNSLTQKGASSATATTFCTGGGHTGTFTPAPEYCDPVPDPFVGLPFPSTSAGCNIGGGNYGGGYTTAQPGVYCGDIALKGTAKVTMAPGIYVLRNSHLTVGSNAMLSGSGVVIILEGTSSFSFEAGSDVTLSAPSSGAFAGVVIAQNKSHSTAGESRIHAGGNVELTGSVYIPNQTLTVSGGGNIGVKAPQMAFVADRFNFTGNGNMALRLNMNSDYDAAGYSGSPLAGTDKVALVR